MSLDDTAAFCGAIKTNPAWAAEDSPGKNSRLHLPESVVDAVLDSEIIKDWSAVDMDEKMKQWQRVRLKDAEDRCPPHHSI